MSRCRRHRDENGNWFWVPGCLARANNDHDCTCDPKKNSNRDLVDRVGDLEARFEAMCRSFRDLRAEVARSTTSGQTR
jgi:hypothetical protein